MTYLSNNIKVNMYTFKGRNSVIFIFATLQVPDWGKLLMKTVCSIGSKFFSLRVDPISDMLCLLVKETASHKSWFPL